MGAAGQFPETGREGAGAPCDGHGQGGDDCAHYGQVLSDSRGQVPAIYQSGPALQASKMCSTTLAPLVPGRIGQSQASQEHNPGRLDGFTLGTVHK